MSIHKRTGISPVLATVILIAITLIAAVAIAGFVFGLFGQLSSSANVSASTVACKVSTGNCIVSLSNTGNTPTSATACTIYATVGTPFTNTPIPAGTTTSVTCDGSAAYKTGTGTSPAVVGQAVSGTVTLASGITVSYAGSWVA